MKSRLQYEAVPREQVEAACPTPKKTRPDMRGEEIHNPNTSGRLYGVTTGRYDSLAVRTQKANLRRKKREQVWVERTFSREHAALSGGPSVQEPKMEGRRYGTEIDAEEARKGINRLRIRGEV